VRNPRTGDKGTIEEVNGQSIHIRHREAPGFSSNTQDEFEKEGWELAG
jgi:hypothetical protein